MAKDFLKALETKDFDSLLGLVESALGMGGIPGLGGEGGGTLSETIKKRKEADPATATSIADLLAATRLPVGSGFLDPNFYRQNAAPQMPMTSGPVQWLGGALEPPKHENLMAGLGAFSNIATTLDLQRRQAKQAEMLKNLTPDQMNQFLLLNLLMGGMGGGQ